MFPVILRNLTAGLASAAGAQIWTSAISHLVTSEKLLPRSARKLIHFTTAPLFILTWPLYTPHIQAGYIAASVPFLFSLRLLRPQNSDPLVTAVSRNKSSSEASRGPAAYGISIAALTALAWRHTPALYVAVAAMCVGDCMADLIGSSLQGPRIPLPANWKKKTLIGSTAFIASGTIAAFAFLNLAHTAGYASLLPAHVVCKGVLAASIAELLPVEDNFTVPLVAYLVAKFA